MIYLDNNATTQPSAGVVDAVQRALTDLWPNPSSVHRPGQVVRHALELARHDLASLVHAAPRDLVLTSGGTESIHLAIRGTLDALPPNSPRHALLTTRVEHAAVRDLADDLARRTRDVRYAPVDSSGLIDLHALDRLLDPSVALLSIQSANNETGVIQPLADIARLCTERRVLLHVDATQSVGKMPLPSTIPADLLSFSPHKFHGPKGIGALYIRPGVRLRPLFPGAQELGRRSGTENVPAILGAAVAAREAAHFLADPANLPRLASLRDRFERDLTHAIPDAVVNARSAPRLWNTSSIAFPRLEAEPLILLLSEKGLCASAGAACSSGSLEPSPVLLAMGIPPELAHGSIRFSLSRHTTQDELHRAVSIIRDAVKTLHASLP